MKAKATGFKIYGKYSTIVEYEYRGKRYEVEYANDMSYCCTSPKTQHEIEQAKIDEEIEREKQPKKPHRYEDTAEYGFNLFWNYVTEGEQK